MKKLTYALLSSLLSLSLVSCSAQVPSATPSSNNAPQSAVASQSQSDAPVSNSGTPLRITIGTAGTAGALYPMGVAMAETITKHVDGISATGESTAASIENLRNLHEGSMALGISQTEVASFAYYGQGDYEGTAYTDIRALYSTIYNYLQVFTRKDSGINSIADLKGKTVSVGSAGSGGEMAARALLSVYGLDYTSINAQFMGEADGATALKDGKIDAIIATHPLASAALTEMTTSVQTAMIPIADDAFYQAYPAYSKFSVPAGTYQGIDTEIVIPRSRIIMCTSTNSGLTDDDVYQIVKAIWENRAEWSESAKAVSTQVLPETALEEIDIPLHPGAIRYFEEIGMPVPDKLKG